MSLCYISAVLKSSPLMKTLIKALPAKLSRHEDLKRACPTLAGTIRATLDNPALERFSDDDNEFLKFHGIYQGDDRDQRKTARRYIFMVRGRLPGGVMNPEHYLTFDRLAAQFANDTLRITSRQALQLHGVVKTGLGPVIRAINEALATTLAASGDVNRNVMAPPTPTASPLVEQVQAAARRVSQALLPQTPAYHQIWVEGRELTLRDDDANRFVDPLYGRTYLPRKFKVAFAIPPLNDVDIFTQCLGFVAIAEQERLAGYNLLAGGGLGMSHGNAQTYARLGDVIGFLTPEQVVPAARAVLTLHRDFGDRANRKHARLKYTLQERGLDWFREELNRRLGFELQPARPFRFTRQGDLLGWHRQVDGSHFLGLYVENGRIRDAGPYRLKTALREVAARFRPQIRLTPSQNLLVTNVNSADREAITGLLAEHGVPVENQATMTRRVAMACPALPTCGRALAEAERVFPNLLTRIEALLAEVGLADEEITIRMTGCPNGCARSLLAEVGLVGRAPNKYQIYLGGNAASARLNRLFKENVRGDDLIAELRPLFTRFAQERLAGERFGDFCRRRILEEQLDIDAAVSPARQAVRWAEARG